MTHKSAFSPEDWQQLRNAPWVVAIAVITSDPSGPVDTGRELRTLLDLVSETDRHRSSNDLIRAVADDVTADRTSGRSDQTSALHGSRSIRVGAIDHCRAVVTILDGTAAPDESREFCAWLHGLAEGVAGAAKEGGFLGFGGAAVSDSEQAMLDELAEALGLEGEVVPDL